MFVSQWTFIPWNEHFSLMLYGMKKPAAYSKNHKPSWSVLGIYKKEPVLTELHCQYMREQRVQSESKLKIRTTLSKTLQMIIEHSWNLIASETGKFNRLLRGTIWQKYYHVTYWISIARWPKWRYHSAHIIFFTYSQGCWYEHRQLQLIN